MIEKSRMFIRKCNLRNELLYFVVIISLIILLGRPNHGGQDRNKDRNQNGQGNADF